MSEYSKKIDVLDSGYVAYSDHMGSDIDIVSDARMSTGGSLKTPEEDKKFLAYLYRHKHTSPFECCELKLEVRMPIFVFREWDRHRTTYFREMEVSITSTDNVSRQYVSKNEFSGRYSEMPDEMYLPDRGRLGAQGKINKQGTDGELEEHLKDEILTSMSSEQSIVKDNYKHYLAKGLSREVARVDLPLSQYTVLKIKANLLNWCKFLDLRLRPNAQWEIRQYAAAVSQIIQDLFPWTWEAFEEYSLEAVTFSRQEMNILRAIMVSVPENSVTDALEHLKWPRSRLEEFLNKLALHNLEDE